MTLLDCWFHSTYECQNTLKNLLRQNASTILHYTRQFLRRTSILKTCYEINLQNIPARTRGMTVDTQNITARTIGKKNRLIKWIGWRVAKITIQLTKYRCKSGRDHKFSSSSSQDHGSSSSRRQRIAYIFRVGHGSWKNRSHEKSVNWECESGRDSNRIACIGAHNRAFVIKNLCELCNLWIKNMLPGNSTSASCKTLEHTSWPLEENALWELPNCKSDSKHESDVVLFDRCKDS